MRCEQTPFSARSAVTLCQELSCESQGVGMGSIEGFSAGSAQAAGDHSLPVSIELPLGSHEAEGA